MATTQKPTPGSQTDNKDALTAQTMYFKKWQKRAEDFEAETLPAQGPDDHRSFPPHAIPALPEGVNSPIFGGHAKKTAVFPKGVR